MENINSAHVTSESIELFRNSFNNAPSFRHICIDNFLDNSFAEELLAHFPSIKEMKKHYDGINEKKSEESDFKKLHPGFQELREKFSSHFFLDWLEKLTGISNLSVPPDFRGAGIYQGGQGSFLDTHIDFSVHPTLNLQRRINVLLFFNKNWQESWGGNLELWNESVTECVSRFQPIFNRCVIFECSNISFHGYDKITSPATIFRKSFYMYFYTPVKEHVRYHDTVFRLKPGVGAFKRIKTLLKENVKTTVKKALKMTGMQNFLDRMEK